MWQDDLLPDALYIRFIRRMESIPNNGVFHDEDTPGACLGDSSKRCLDLFPSGLLRPDARLSARHNERVIGAMNLRRLETWH
jgi:hypothetical protein